MNLPYSIRINDEMYRRPQSLQLPAGHSLFQLKEDMDLYGKVRDEASDGCPAIFTLIDDQDIFLNEQWQLFIYAANFGMRKNNVSSLWGRTKALTNDTNDSNFRDVVSRVNMDSTMYPRLDKLRTFLLNTHAARRYDDKRIQLLTMDGKRNPPMKLGRVRPSTVEDIDSGRVTINDYLFTPRTHPHLFLVCNNMRRKRWNDDGTPTTYGYTVFPYDNGLLYDWTVAKHEMYSFFPFVSEKPLVLSLARYWNPVSSIKSPYRRR